MVQRAGVAVEVRCSAIGREAVVIAAQPLQIGQGAGVAAQTLGKRPGVFVEVIEAQDLDGIDRQPGVRQIVQALTGPAPVGLRQRGVSGEGHVDGQGLLQALAGRRHARARQVQRDGAELLRSILQTDHGRQQVLRAEAQQPGQWQSVGRFGHAQGLRRLAPGSGWVQLRRHPRHVGIDQAGSVGHGSSLMGRRGRGAFCSTPASVPVPA